MQNVLDSMVSALLADKNRKFTYAEQVSLLVVLISAFTGIELYCNYEPNVSSYTRKKWNIVLPT